VLTVDAERWANLASLRVFNKPLAAVISDFDKTGAPIDEATLASLIALGKEIEAADASRAQGEDLDRANGGISEETGTSLIKFGRESEVADTSRMQLGSAPTPPARRTHMTRFQMLVVGVLAFAVVGGFWSTRWVYYDQKIGGVTGTATVRVNRWTGDRQTLQCGPLLTREAQGQVRALQAQLSLCEATFR
jgi:hypothetical protein